MSGMIVPILAGLTTAILVYQWLRAMQRVEMAERMRLLNALAIVAVVLGVAAFTVEAGFVAGLLASIAILIGGVFLALGFFLSAQSKQPPALGIGSPLLPFTAPDENGEPFEFATLSRKPILLKFFRGHW